MFRSKLGFNCGGILTHFDWTGSSGVQHHLRRNRRYVSQHRSDNLICGTRTCFRYSVIRADSLVNKIEDLAMLKISTIFWTRDTWCNQHNFQLPQLPAVQSSTKTISSCPAPYLRQGCMAGRLVSQADPGQMGAHAGVYTSYAYSQRSRRNCLTIRPSLR